MLDVQLKTFRHCSCLDFLYIRDFKHYVFFRLYEVEFLLKEFITKESTHMEEMFVGGRKSRWLAFHRMPFKDREEGKSLLYIVIYK